MISNLLTFTRSSHITLSKQAPWDKNLSEEHYKINLEIVKFPMVNTVVNMSTVEKATQLNLDISDSEIHKGAKTILEKDFDK